MKFLMILLTFLSVNISAQNYTFMTYNIRYANQHDNLNKWDLRKERLLAQVRFQDPDIIGLQEALSVQVKYIDSVLADYSFVGIGREDGKTKGEYSPIFYKTNKFELIDQSTFWLSDRPDTVSVGWDAALERICTYAVLRNIKSGEKFLLMNTHFDHAGNLARLNSSKLIAKKMNEINKDDIPVLLMGDFNLEPSSEPIKYLSKVLNDSKSISDKVYGNDGTFNGFNTAETPKRRIDYIFTSHNDVEVLSYGVLSDLINQRYNSDHFPVVIKARFN